MDPVGHRLVAVPSASSASVRISRAVRWNLTFGGRRRFACPFQIRSRLKAELSTHRLQPHDPISAAPAMLLLLAAAGCTVVVSEELLFAGFGSAVLELTVAVLVIVSLPRIIIVARICAAS